jgi:ABC-type nickel/cobalt efflux system permease component RcnA
MKIPIGTLLGGLLWAVGAAAHPMGNFSVSHYSRLDFTTTGVALTYVLDLAEIPTLEILQKWQIDGKDEIQLHSKAAEQANVWLQNLTLAVDGRPLAPRLAGVIAKTTDGAGGMLVLRVAMQANVAVQPGQLSFEDRNYANRTGWKEIVLRGGGGVSLAGASHADRDVSRELTVYPADPTFAPPQDLAAFARWSATGAPPEQFNPERSRKATPAPVPRAVNKPALPATPIATVSAAIPIAAATFAERQSAGPGAVTRGDFLSVMLRDRKFGLGSILLGLLIAFSLGGMHALSPGHGKTIVAAYLVGSRGTLRHALFLGCMVTFTHTVSVFLLGLGVLFFQKYVVPDQIIPVLATVSGLSIVCIGSWLLYQRSKALMGSGALEHGHHSHAAGGHHHHAHTHSHESHSQSHTHSHDGHTHDAQAHSHNDHARTRGGHSHESHAHSHDGLTHTHGGHTHSHAIPDSRLTLGGLVALGASGGLVPCPSALILLLSAIALGHTALGLGLLAAFSAGLAVVLMGIGALVLFAKHLFPAPGSARSHPLFRLVPVYSSVVVIVLGLLMTLSALGWMRPIRAFGV